MDRTVQLSAGQILTYTGRAFSPLEPTQEDIDIVDIAWSLAHIGRWGGHAHIFVSVASHSLRVADRAPEHLKLAALLHDAPEAYLGDVVRPLKRLPQYAFLRKAEDRLLYAIGLKYGVTAAEFAAVKQYDDAQLAAEFAAFMTHERQGEPMDWKNWRHTRPVPTVALEDWTREAYAAHMGSSNVFRLYLDTFESLTKAKGGSVQR